jgi:hypothetical protein
VNLFEFVLGIDRGFVIEGNTYGHLGVDQGSKLPDEGGTG